MNKRIKRLISLLLTLSMLLGLLMVSAQAATEQNDSQESSQASVELVFEYPKDVPKDEVKLSVFQGIPQWRQKNDAKTIEDVPEVLTNPTNPNYPKLKEILPDKDGKYIVKNKLVKPIEGLTEEENDNWKYEDRGTYKIEADKLIMTSELEAPGYETITFIIQKFSKNSITLYDPKEKEEQLKSVTFERIPESDF